jgi:hypothetical protein
MDAQRYLGNSSSFLKKQDLRTNGPRQLTIANVIEAEGLPRVKGEPAPMELRLVFSDGTQFALRARVNLDRVIGWFGNDTELWKGKVIVAYFSDDVTNPSGGEPGGIRLRLPDSRRAPKGYRSDLDEPRAATAFESPRPTTTARSAAGRPNGTGSVEDDSF